MIGGRNLAGSAASERKAVRRDVQMIFQDPYASLDPRMTRRRARRRAAAHPRHRLARTSARDRVAALFERVGLSPEQMARYPHEFSGGQRQRICIARALALAAEADRRRRERLGARRLGAGARAGAAAGAAGEFGVAYLFISHDMAVVEHISDRVAVMYLGQIVEMGTRDQVFANPRHPYTRRLIEAVPVPDPAQRRARFARLDGEIPSPVRRLGDPPRKLVLPMSAAGILLHPEGPWNARRKKSVHSIGKPWEDAGGQEDRAQLSDGDFGSLAEARESPPCSGKPACRASHPRPVPRRHATHETICATGVPTGTARHRRHCLASVMRAAPARAMGIFASGRHLLKHVDMPFGLPLIAVVESEQSTGAGSTIESAAVR